MIEIGHILDQFTPGAAGVWTGVFMLAAWMLKEWRETRKLTADDRQARREGYAKQVEGLQLENRALRGDVQKINQQYDDYRRLCQLETDQLRSQILNLQNEQMGYKRKFAEMGAFMLRIRQYLPVGIENDFDFNGMTNHEHH